MRNISGQSNGKSKSRSKSKSNSRNNSIKKVKDGGVSPAMGMSMGMGMGNTKIPPKERKVFFGYYFDQKLKEPNRESSK